MVKRKRQTRKKSRTKARKKTRKKPGRKPSRRSTKKKMAGRSKAGTRKSKSAGKPLPPKKSRRRKPKKKNPKQRDPTKVHSLFDYYHKDDHKTTLEMEKDRFFSGLPRGVRCHCCGRYAKLHNRQINRLMGVALVLIHREFQRKPSLRWLHVERFLLARRGIPKAIRGDWHKFKYYGLIETKPELREDGSPRNGYWRLTRKGRSFVRGKTRIPLRANTYNDTLYGFGPPEVSIFDVLRGSGFDYTKLMNG